MDGFSRYCLDSDVPGSAGIVAGTETARQNTMIGHAAIIVPLPPS
jgi:hypothetical protein